MTIRERLSIIGQVLTNKRIEPEVVEVIKEVPAKEKAVIGSFLDFGMKGLSDETNVSSKTLNANVGWVYRNNDVIAKEVSNIEFELYTTRIVGQEIVYNRIYQHPILDLLDRFNEYTAAADGFYTTESHRKLTGDAFWYLVGKAPNIAEIYILPPDKVTLQLGKVEGTQRVVQSYKYEDTIKGETIEHFYEPDEIIHFKMPNPKNSYRGLGVVEAAADTIDTDNMAIDANKSFYKRGLIANFILKTEHNITDAQMKQLHAEFKNTYGGVENAFKVPILGNGVEPSMIQMSNKDMQFMDQQAWSRDKITALFGNNKAVIGVTDDVNRANAEASILSWKRTTIRSEMKGICDTLNEFLVPKYGTNLILGFCDPVEEDESQEIDDVVKLIQSNVITANEARERLSIDPLKDPTADQLRQNLAIPLIPKGLKHINLDRALRKSQTFKQLEVAKQKGIIEDTAKQLAHETATKIVKSRKKTVAPEAKPEGYIAPAPYITEDKAMEYYKKQMSTVEHYEKKFHDAVEKFINKLVEKAISQVPAEIQEIQNKTLFNEDEEIVQAGLDFGPILLDTAKASGNEALGLIDYGKPYIVSHDMQAELERRVDLFATSMVNTDKEKLLDIITQGVQNGQSVTDIRSSITDTFDQYSKMQAERITRTEVLNASNMAALDSWKQSGVVDAQQWLTAGATDECAAYEGQVKALDEGFFDSDEWSDGEPPIHPNCRCTLIPVLWNDQERLSLADDERGFINSGSDDEGFAVYHGTGSTATPTSNTFGNAFYVARDRKTAAEYGEVTKYSLPFGEKSILKIESEDQYQYLVDQSIKYAAKTGGDLDSYQALPKYIKHLGYKAAEMSDAVDPFAGIGVIDKKVIKELKNQLKDSGEITKLKGKLKERDDYIEELEGFIDEKA